MKIYISISWLTVAVDGVAVGGAGSRTTVQSTVLYAPLLQPVPVAVLLVLIWTISVPLKLAVEITVAGV